jgi:hypothetical protein
MLCDNVEHVLWQCCMAVCAQCSTDTLWCVRQFVATKSQKISSTHLLAMQMSQLEENMPQELGLSKRNKL